MDREKQKDFVGRISQANRTGLVAITFEIIGENIKEAIKRSGDGDVPGFRKELKGAQGFLAELIRSLDYRYPISLELLRLYEYVQRILVSSEVSGKDRGLKSALGVTEGLGSAFSEIAGQDDSGNVMENTQKIYLGLTYGKGTLNESDLSSSGNRGFLV